MSTTASWSKLNGAPTKVVVGEGVLGAQIDVLIFGAEDDQRALVDQ